MQVRELEDGVAIEGFGQAGNGQVVLAHLDHQGVASPAPEQAHEPQACPDQRMHRIPVLEVEKMGAPTEDMGLVIPFEAQPLPDMQMSQARFQRRKRSRLVGGGFQ